MKRTTVQLVDDLDNSVIADGAGRTIDFSLDGQTYEIDMSNVHIQELKDALAPYVKVARPIRRRMQPPVAKKTEVQAIREWANENGLKVSDRGRISASVREAYAASQR